MASLAAGMAVPNGAEGQRPRSGQTRERFLFITPLPDVRSDSGYVLALAVEVRNRLAGRTRNQVHVISTEQYCTVLVEHGFQCSFPLDPRSSRQLADAFRADAYATGEFQRDNGVPVARFRIVDIGCPGIAGTLSVPLAMGRR